MTPSPTEKLEVQRRDLVQNERGWVNLLPVETVPQETDGLVYFKVSNVVPTGGFYFPESRSGGIEQMASHVNLVEKLLYDAARHDAEAIKRLKDLYGTTLDFSGCNNLEAIRLRLNKETKLRLHRKLATKITSNEYEPSLGPVCAFLALDGKGQQQVLQAARENGLSQFDYKTGVRVSGNRLDLRYYDDSLPLGFTSHMEGEFILSQFGPGESLEPIMPFYMAVSGPAPTFAEFIKGLRGE